MKNNYKTMIIGIIIAVTISVTFSYALAETIMNSKDVYYKDNSGLAVNNVQDAIDGTCTKFESKVDNFLDKIYPIGSIYISATLSTVDQVKETLGGEWEVYGDGRTLLSSSAKSEQTGGASEISLTVDNLPAHSHTYDKSNANTGSHTLTISEMPEHTHEFTAGGSAIVMGANADSATFATDNGFTPSIQGWFKGFKKDISKIKVTGGSTGHTHTISTTKTQTEQTGSGETINIQNPYITVYMYKRTK